MSAFLWPDSLFVLADSYYPLLTRKQILMAALLTTMCALGLIVYYHCVRVARYIFQINMVFIHAYIFFMFKLRVRIY